VLLVLDSFEHLAGAAFLMPVLLDHCPRLRLLVTSRAVLQLSWELVFVVQPRNRYFAHAVVLKWPPLSLNTGKYTGVFDLHRLQISRVQAEQLQDRRRDLGRFHRVA
jgi:hypothetical protein